jgi:hypothetical protein
MVARASSPKSAFAEIATGSTLIGGDGDQPGILPDRPLMIADC